MRQLILLRHAKTEPYSDSGSDETRKLTERGHEDAALMAGTLASLGIHPDIALVSTARRTRETWRHVSEVYPDLKHKYFEELYLAEPDEIARTVTKNAAADSILVIGHNPGIHDLAMRIAGVGGTASQEALSRLYLKYPTGAFALFEAKGEKVVDEQDLQLVDFQMPSMFKDA